MRTFIGSVGVATSIMNGVVESPMTVTKVPPLCPLRLSVDDGTCHGVDQRALAVTELTGQLESYVIDNDVFWFSGYRLPLLRERIERRARGQYCSRFCRFLQTYVKQTSFGKF
jgi:hypothetical protein